MADTQKASLRQEIRNRMLRTRSALCHEERQEAAMAVCRRVLGLGAVSTAAVYLPIRAEVDTWPLIRAFWAQGTVVLAPRCRQGCPGAMDWFIIASAQDLAPGSFGILEPDPRRAIPAQSVPQLVLVPGLAFDVRGYRLGYGGGYYDRYLATHPQVWSLGLAYDFQLLDALPVEPWDRPVHGVITPSRNLEISPCPLSSTSTSQDFPTSASPSPPAAAE